MITRIDKAIVAGLGAAATVVATVQINGGTNNVEVVGIIALAAGIVVGVVTFFVPNKPAAPPGP